MNIKNKFYIGLISFVLLCIAFGAVYYFAYFLPKQYKIKQEVKATKK